MFKTKPTVEILVLLIQVDLVNVNCFTAKRGKGVIWGVGWPELNHPQPIFHPCNQGCASKRTTIRGEEQKGSWLLCNHNLLLSL